MDVSALTKNLHSEQCLKQAAESLGEKIMEKQLTGVELIAKERQEQLLKHGRSILLDVTFNNNKELIQGARELLNQHPAIMGFPKEWHPPVVHRMASKNYKERLIIAGALIAAEIDRLQYLDSTKQV